MNNKVCSICKEEKDINLFVVRPHLCKDGGTTYPRHPYCDSCRTIKARKISKKAYERNKDKIHLKYLANKDDKRAYDKEYELKNKIKINKRKLKYHKQKYKTDNNYKFSCLMATSLGDALKSKKSGRSWESLVGYKIEELRSHLENLFESGMTWSNHGKYNHNWQVGHRIPVCSFDFSTNTENKVRECWDLDNLFPQWKIDNLYKVVEDTKLSHRRNLQKIVNNSVISQS